jgi:type I restriction enzyme, S subunit
MNVHRLLALYDRIADAPHAIGRLRRFVLELAVTGRLVPQNPMDEPASRLLSRIEIEKGQMAGRSGSRGRRTGGREPSVSFDFVLPPGWALSTLGSVASKITDGTHQTPTYVSSGVPFVSIKDFSDGLLDLSNTRMITEEEHRLLYKRCDPKRGDILIGRIGTLGRAVLVNTDDEFSLFVSVGLIRFSHANLVPDFFRMLLNSPVLEAEFNRIKIGGGTHTNKLNLGDLHTVALPMPPLPEQHRIVAKVDELMALCDRLEAARAEREARRDRLTAASLARLNAPDPITFPTDARFVLRVLPVLTSRVDQIAHFRQAVLNLAVRGMLSPAGAWCSTPTRLGDVASLQNGYAFKSEWFSKSGTRLVRNANVGHGSLEWADEVRLPESKVQDYERFRLAEGDVVLTLDRPFITTGTKVARVTARDLPALLLQRVGRFVLSEALHPDYLFAWINSPHFSEQINPGRSNGVPHISSKQVEAAVLFLPPLAEQHRIVAKVDELVALCDRLEESLTTSEETRGRLLDALLHEALTVPSVCPMPVVPEPIAAHG